MTKCDLFQKISSEVWDIISRNHERNNRLSEEGITRQTIISMIQDHVEQNENFEVYAQKAKNEVITGSDIEIYIQNSQDTYVRILIQVKLMEPSGQFININKDSGSTGIKQYDSLIKYSTNVRALSYYLFLNGISKYNESNMDCLGSFAEKQYGCALLNSHIVKEYCETNNTGVLGNVLNTKPVGKPWRLLTCCPLEVLSETKSYTPEEIDSDKHFKRLFSKNEFVNFVTSSKTAELNKIKISNKNIHNSGWNPLARIILTSNKFKLKLEDKILKPFISLR